MTSPDGACKSFDSTANGYARAEGVACVVIKRQMEGAQPTQHLAAALPLTPRLSHTCAHGAAPVPRQGRRSA